MVSLVPFAADCDVLCEVISLYFKPSQSINSTRCGLFVELLGGFNVAQRGQDRNKKLSAIP